jgi:hypothetical protein
MMFPLIDKPLRESLLRLDVILSLGGGSSQRRRPSISGHAAF